MHAIITVVNTMPYHKKQQTVKVKNKPQLSLCICLDTIQVEVGTVYHSLIYRKRYRMFARFKHEIFPTNPSSGLLNKQVAQRRDIKSEKVHQSPLQSFTFFAVMLEPRWGPL